MWSKIGDTSLDISDVSNVTLQREYKRIIVTMKGGQQLVFSPGEISTAESLFESITSLLEEMTERNDKRVEDEFELFKRTLNELESISQYLKLISESLRRK